MDISLDIVRNPRVSSSTAQKEAQELLNHIELRFMMNYLQMMEVGLHKMWESHRWEMKQMKLLKVGLCMGMAATNLSHLRMAMPYLSQVRTTIMIQF